MDPAWLVRRALGDATVRALIESAGAVDVIAAGKCADGMLSGFTASGVGRVRHVLRVGPSDAAHPVPDGRSVAAGERALAMAAATGGDDLLLVLLSGGASAMLEAPAPGTTLEDLRHTVAELLRSGETIGEINAVRRRLSRIKGGRLAAAAAGPVLTLAISDVVGDDPAVIGSGPTVSDPGAPPRPRTTFRIIGGLGEALDGAARCAADLGYRVHRLDEPIVGEARNAAGRLIAAAAAVSRDPGDARPLCVLAGGETTVTVRGRGRGGRNQELALALAPLLATLGGHVMAASVGTDGVDGPTDAAGAVVDDTTLARAARAGLDINHYLNDNNSYAFFDVLGDLIRAGSTGTNVGDLQTILID